MVWPAITNGAPDERILLLDGMHEDMLSHGRDPKGAVIGSDDQLK